MNDLQLETTLVGNAAPLNAALQSGAQGVKAYGEAAEKAALGAAAASRQNTDAVTAMTAAIAKAKTGGDAYGKTAEMVRDNTRQTAAAMRMLPAQMTDVATQLAGGANPLLVLLQQGGQVKDSFGGLGPMFRGLAAAISPTVVAFGGLAAVGGSVAVAYAKGATEADAYRRAIVLSGNAAGATVGQMQEQAAAVALLVSTQGRAAEVLALMAAEGTVAAGNFRQLAEAALQLERVGGPAAEETAKAFVELGREPLKASIKLNESTNFLTQSVYRQVKALAEQGRTAEAAGVAQRAYAEIVASRAKELEGSLGTLQTAWMKLGEAAKGAWDFMLNVGRKETPEEQVASLQRGIDSLTAEMGGEGVSDARFKVLDEARQKLIDMQGVLQSDIRVQRQAAQATAQRAEAVKETIKADEAAKAAAKAAQEAYDRFKQSMLEGLNASAAELRLGRELTDVERTELKVKEDLAEAHKKVGGARFEELKALAANRIEQDRLVRAQRDAAKAREDVDRAAQQAGAEAYREAQGIRDGNDTLREQIEAMGTLEAHQVRLRQVRIENQIQAKQEMLDELERVGLTGVQTQALRDQINALRERQRLLGAQLARSEEVAWTEALRKRDEMERQADEARRDGIAMSISEGVASGTLSAKKLWDIFRGELVRQFAKTVLMPNIRPAVDGADSWIKGAISWAGSLFTGGDFGSVPADSPLSSTGAAIHGRRAGGGQVQPWGRYLVGERGPEVLQMGSMGGSVLPNNGGSWGGNQVVQNITYNVPDGYTPAMFATAMQQNNEALEGKIAGDMARPGRLMNRAARLARF